MIAGLPRMIAAENSQTPIARGMIRILLLAIAIIASGCGSEPSPPVPERASAPSADPATPIDTADSRAPALSATEGTPTEPLEALPRPEHDPATWGPNRLVLSDAADSSGAPPLARIFQVSTTPEVGLRVLYGPKELVTASDHDISVVAKTGNLYLLQIAGNGSEEFFANFDLRRGAVVRRGVNTPNATIEPLGGGWYRLTATFRYAGDPLEFSIRRLLVIDDPNAAWHAESSVSGHFFLDSPSPSPTSGDGR
jgi:hypothetical protein